MLHETASRAARAVANEGPSDSATGGSFPFSEGEPYFLCTAPRTYLFDASKAKEAPMTTASNIHISAPAGAVSGPLTEALLAAGDEIQPLSGTQADELDRLAS